jgi:hypothetical protein
VSHDIDITFSDCDFCKWIHKEAQKLEAVKNYGPLHEDNPIADYVITENSGVNFTYNYGPAIWAATGEKWGISTLDGKSPAEASSMLRELIVTLENNPDKYEPLIQGKGAWGTMKTLLRSLRQLEHIIEHQSSAGIIRVS